MERENQSEPAPDSQTPAVPVRPTPPALRYVKEGFFPLWQPKQPQPPSSDAIVEAPKQAAGSVRPTPPPLQYRKLGHPPREK